MKITLRGFEHTLIAATNFVVQTLISHADSNSSIPLATRHSNTIAVLNAILDPALDSSLVKNGLLLLNDTELLPILKAAADLLSQDSDFANSVEEIKKIAPGAADNITQIMGELKTDPQQAENELREILTSRIQAIEPDKLRQIEALLKP